MYNNEKFLYVTVEMEKGDYALNNLIEDLENWCPKLYLSIDNDDKVIYKGLIPKKEFENLKLLISASPYGGGYNVNVEGKMLR